MILSFLFFFFLAYLFYRLVFHFIIPIYQTTRKVKRGFRNMQETMNGQAPYGSHHTEEEKKPNLDNVGEYIDFEEVK